MTTKIVLFFQSFILHNSFFFSSKTFLFLLQQWIQDQKQPHGMIGKNGKWSFDCFTTKIPKNNGKESPLWMHGESESVLFLLLWTLLHKCSNYCSKLKIWSLCLNKNPNPPSGPLTVQVKNSALQLPYLLFVWWMDWWIKNKRTNLLDPSTLSLNPWISPSGWSISVTRVHTTNFLLWIPWRSPFNCHYLGCTRIIGLYFFFSWLDPPSTSSNRWTAISPPCMTIASNWPTLFISHLHLILSPTLNWTLSTSLSSPKWVYTTVWPISSPS